MNRPMMIGLTGPTGAGKSTAAKAFEALGAGVIDCLTQSRAGKLSVKHTELLSWMKRDEFPVQSWRSRHLHVQAVQSA